MTVTLRASAALAFAVLLAAPALAHGGHDGHGAGGFWNGFVHPFTGWDHVLAMLAVGAFAARRGGVALWVVPVGFLLAMAAGAAMALSHWAAPWVETTIVVSVLVGVIAVWTANRAPLALVAIVGGIFALAHGWAHGAAAVHSHGAGGFVLGSLAGGAVLLTVGLAVMRLVAAGWARRRPA